MVKNWRLDQKVFEIKSKVKPTIISNNDMYLSPVTPDAGEIYGASINTNTYACWRDHSNREHYSGGCRGRSLCRSAAIHIRPVVIATGIGCGSGANCTFWILA